MVHPPWQEKFHPLPAGSVLSIVRRICIPSGIKAGPSSTTSCNIPPILFTSVSTFTEVKRFHLSIRARARPARVRHRCHAFHASPSKHLPHFAPPSIRFLGLTSIEVGFPHRRIAKNSANLAGTASFLRVNKPKVGRKQFDFGIVRIVMSASRTALRRLLQVFNALSTALLAAALTLRRLCFAFLCVAMSIASLRTIKNERELGGCEARFAMKISKIGPRTIRL